MNDNTNYVFAEAKDKVSSKELLQKICDYLKERGYDPTKQIAGYVISGDPGYITSYKNCRNLISKIDRTTLVEEMLEEFLK